MHLRFHCHCSILQQQRRAEESNANLSALHLDTRPLDCPQPAADQRLASRRSHQFGWRSHRRVHNTMLATDGLGSRYQHDAAIATFTSQQMQNGCCVGVARDAACTTDGRRSCIMESIYIWFMCLLNPHLCLYAHVRRVILLYWSFWPFVHLIFWRERSYRLYDSLFVFAAFYAAATLFLYLQVPHMSSRDVLIMRRVQSVWIVVCFSGQIRVSSYCLSCLCMCNRGLHHPYMRVQRYASDLVASSSPSSPIILYESFIRSSSSFLVIDICSERPKCWVVTSATRWESLAHLYCLASDSYDFVSFTKTRLYALVFWSDSRIRVTSLLLSICLKFNLHVTRLQCFHWHTHNLAFVFCSQLLLRPLYAQVIVILLRYEDLQWHKTQFSKIQFA